MRRLLLIFALCVVATAQTTLKGNAHLTGVSRVGHAPDAPPVISTFTCNGVTPTCSGASGFNAVLAWTVTGGTSCTINGVAVANCNTNQTFNPTVNTTYVLCATNLGGSVCSGSGGQPTSLTASITGAANGCGTNVSGVLFDQSTCPAAPANNKYCCTYAGSQLPVGMQDQISGTPTVRHLTDACGPGNTNPPTYCTGTNSLDLATGFAYVLDNDVTAHDGTNANNKGIAYSVVSGVILDLQAHTVNGHLFRNGGLGGVSGGITGAVVLNGTVSFASGNAGGGSSSYTTGGFSVFGGVDMESLSCPRFTMQDVVVQPTDGATQRSVTLNNVGGFVSACDPTKPNFYLAKNTIYGPDNTQSGPAPGRTYAVAINCNYTTPPDNRLMIAKVIGNDIYTSNNNPLSTANAQQGVSLGYCASPNGGTNYTEVASNRITLAGKVGATDGARGIGADGDNTGSTHPCDYCTIDHNYLIMGVNGNRGIRVRQSTNVHISYNYIDADNTSGALTHVYHLGDPTQTGSVTEDNLKGLTIAHDTILGGNNVSIVYGRTFYSSTGTLDIGNLTVGCAAHGCSTESWLVDLRQATLGGNCATSPALCFTELLNIHDIDASALGGTTAVCGSGTCGATVDGSSDAANHDYLIYGPNITFGAGQTAAISKTTGVNAPCIKTNGNTCP